MSEAKGLARAREVYENREKRAKELKEQGKKIAGYICCYVPLELITAADLVPYRILGDVKEPVTKADAHIEPISCPFIRSCFDLALKGRYEFVDLFIGAHSCDNCEKSYDIWRWACKYPYTHFIEIPHSFHDPSRRLFKLELNRFKKHLEEIKGGQISDGCLRQAVKLYNEQRTLVRGLYELRKQQPPLIAGSEVLQVLVAAMSLPVEEGNELLREVIQEIKERQQHPPEKGARVLLWGGMVDNMSFMQLVEECGAHVVMDDLAIGSKFYWADVKETEDPLEGLATRYFDGITCPRTFRDRFGSYKEHLEQRFSYLREFARDFKVNAVILAVLSYCDIMEFDAPELKDYLQEAGFPVLHLEHDYNITALAPLRTRIQAFLEMLGETSRRMV